MSSRFLKNTANIDSHKLRQVLSTISEQLKISFLANRHQSNSHKKTPVEELRDVIADITEKEKELAAAVGIATMLLDNNDDLMREVTKHLENENFLKAEIRLLKSELKNCREAIEKEENRYEAVTETLVKTENELLRISVDQQKENLRPDTLRFELQRFEFEMNEMKDYYLNEVAGLNKKLNEFQRTQAKMTKEHEAVLSELKLVKEQYSNICMKYKNTHEKAKESEKINSILLETNDKLEKKHKQLVLNYSKLVDRLEILEEELKIAETSFKTRASGNESIQDLTLFSELQKLESFNDYSKLIIEIPDDPIIEPRASGRRKSYTPQSGKFFFSESKLSIVIFKTITIPSKLKESRKDPIEEYFILTTQAVKLNSPHMDTICVIPHIILYEKAKREEIPFHKWHIWIETQLNAEYIQTIYRRSPEKQQGLSRFFRGFSLKNKFLV